MYVITLEVVSRGMVTDSDMMTATFKFQKRMLEEVVTNIIRITLLESFKIWCSRNVFIEP